MTTKFDKDDKYTIAEPLANGLQNKLGKLFTCFFHIDNTVTKMVNSERNNGIIFQTVAIGMPYIRKG